MKRNRINIELQSKYENYNDNMNINNEHDQELYCASVSQFI